MNFITELIILLSLGIIGGLTVKKLKIPSLVGYIFGGILFSIIFSSQNSSNIKDLAQIGITLLLFSIGIDFSIDKLMKVKKYSIIGGVLQIVLTIILSILLFGVFKFNFYESLFLGSVFSLSSTAIIAKILDEKNETETFFGQITIGWCVIQDIAVVVIILLLSSFTQENTGFIDIIESLLKSLILILLALVVGRKVIPRILTSVSKNGSNEMLIIVAFTFAILFSFVSEYLGVSSTLGAFLAGLMISESIYTHEIITEVKPFQTIFSMLFFVTIGTLFSVSYFVSNIFLIVGVLLVGLLLKFILILVINHFNNLNVKTNLFIALSLSQIGEFAFLISQIGLNNGWIDQDLSNLILSTTILSMVISSFIIKNNEHIFELLDKVLKKRLPLVYRRMLNRGVTESFDINQLTNHIIVCGYGKVGKYVVKGIKKINEPFIVIEHNDNEIDKDMTENFIIGDATNKEILILAKLEKAKICIITMPKDADVEAILKICMEINPDLKIITRIHDKISEEYEKYILAQVGPEHETAVRMVEKILRIYNKRNKKVNLK